METGIHDAEMIEANGFGNVVAEMDPLEPVADGADPSQDPQYVVPNGIVITPLVF